MMLIHMQQARGAGWAGHLPALLEGLLGSAQWMAARLGERGGRVRTDAKAAAGRTNGRLGGRPRKTTPA